MENVFFLIFPSKTQTHTHTNTVSIMVETIHTKQQRQGRNAKQRGKSATEWQMLLREKKNERKNIEDRKLEQT